MKFEVNSVIFVLNIPKYFHPMLRTFGQTDLITMGIETGDSLPISQWPYNLPLKFTAWVQEEQRYWKKTEILFKVFHLGLVQLWSFQNEDTPRRRLCVDYRALNNIFPPVTKAHSKAKGVLMLVPPTTDWWDLCLISWLHNLFNPRFKEWLLPHSLI